MTSHRISKLIEAASLDALGLLDEQEREEFERDFRAAPPHIQAQVRRHQLRFTDMDGWLPQVAPPPGLKGRVMAAVRKAIAEVAAQPALAGRIQGTLAYRLFNAAPVWRAACIGFAVASLVLGSFMLDFMRAHNQLAQNINRAGMTEGLAQLLSVSDYDEFQRATAAGELRPVAFAPAAPDFASVNATLQYNGAAGHKSFLFCRDLPDTSSGFALVLINVQGGIIEHIRHTAFESNGRDVIPVEFIAPQDIHRLGIIDEDTDQIILRAEAV